MSLIEEALRRVQTLPPPAPRPEAMPQAPEIRAIPITPPQPRSASQIPWRGAAVGAAGVLILGWGIWMTTGVFRAASRPPQKGTASRPVPAPTSRRAMLSLPMKPQLTLSGVIGGPGEPMAIINGSLLGPGDAIEGATLLDVTGDSARLRWRDEDVVLRLAR